MDIPVRSRYHIYLKRTAKLKYHSVTFKYSWIPSNSSHIFQVSSIQNFHHDFYAPPLQPQDVWSRKEVLLLQLQLRATFSGSRRGMCQVSALEVFRMLRRIRYNCQLDSRSNSFRAGTHHAPHVCFLEFRWLNTTISGRIVDSILPRQPLTGEHHPRNLQQRYTK